VIEIRTPKDIAECNALEPLQIDIWQTAEGLVPGEIFFIALKNGGTVLAAYDLEVDPTKPIGFAFSIVGLTKEGKLRHHSHQAGVLPEYRDKNLGYKLKLAQREFALQQGIDWIIWTCDPLESRNANFNFHKLRASCNTYYEHLYGDMGGINEGLPSDRFQPDWFLSSERVVRRLSGETLLAFAEVAKNAQRIEANQTRPQDNWTLEHEKVLLEIPADFRALKTIDKELALAWRMFTRTVFQQAFSKGYSVTDFLLEQGRGYYFLELS
jgi:predicted GNAT superfamily acetyltransferase